MYLYIYMYVYRYPLTQVGQTLRLLEILIWEDPELQTLLRGRGLVFEDVRATYAIVMTGLRVERLS